MITQEAVKKLFNQILEPKLKWSINALNLLKKIEIGNNKIIIHVNLITRDKKQNPIPVL